jgi:uncharacterized protein YdaU (DUF1376 family)
MAEFPALPLWTDAYLADTADLDAREHGCYLILLMIAWRRPDCALPNDLKWMHRALNAYCGGSLHGRSFNFIVPTLLSRFFVLDGDGKWQQKRLRKEREFVSNFSRTQSENASKRWRKPIENQSKSNRNGLEMVSKRQSRTYENNDLADAMATKLAMPPHPHPHPPERGSSSSNSETSGEERISSNEKYAVEYRRFRLTHDDLERWKRSFPHVAVEGQCIAKALWASKQPNPFVAMANMLAKFETEATKPNGATEKPVEYDAYWQKI